LPAKEYREDHLPGAIKPAVAATRNRGAQSARRLQAGDRLLLGHCVRPVPTGRGGGSRRWIPRRLRLRSTARSTGWRRVCPPKAPTPSGRAPGPLPVGTHRRAASTKRSARYRKEWRAAGWKACVVVNGERVGARSAAGERAGGRPQPAHRAGDASRAQHVSGPSSRSKSSPTTWPSTSCPARPSPRRTAGWSGDHPRGRRAGAK